MNNIFYPVVFLAEEVGYSIRVPDLDGCFSEGDTMDEACSNVKDAIGLYLEDCKEYPTPSVPSDLSLEPSEFVVMIEFDVIAYKKKHDTKAVKKTLSIPSWLNEEAERQHVNFSGILQDALKQHLNL